MAIALNTPLKCEGVDQTKYFVYEIKSTKHGVSYIGATNNPANRFKEHQKDKMSSIYPWLKVHGSNDFSFDVIREFNNPFECSLQESKLINNFNNKSVELVNNQCAGRYQPKTDEIHVKREIVIISKMEQIFQQNIVDILTKYTLMAKIAIFIDEPENSNRVKALHKEMLSHISESEVLFNYLGKLTTYESVVMLRIAIKAKISAFTYWAREHIKV